MAPPAICKKRYPMMYLSWGFRDTMWNVHTHTPLQGIILTPFRCQNLKTLYSMLVWYYLFPLDHQMQNRVNYVKFIRCLVSRILSKIFQRSTNFPNSLYRVRILKMLRFQWTWSQIVQFSTLRHKKNSLPFVWSHLITISDTQRSAVCNYYA